jgi:hypothetical protein
MSYFGRVNYDFDNRGFVGISVRRDGSSNFAPKINLPFSLCICRLAFKSGKVLQNLKWLDEFKLRASFGYTGNPNVLPMPICKALTNPFNILLEIQQDLVEWLVEPAPWSFI